MKSDFFNLKKIKIFVIPGELFCCLLPQCEALRACCLGFLIATPIPTNTSVAAISRFLCLWFTMSCTMCMVGIATHFLGIFTVC